MEFLPDELIAKILNHLSGEDIKKLLLTNRRFYYNKSILISYMDKKNIQMVLPYEEVFPFIVYYFPSFQKEISNDYIKAFQVEGDYYGIFSFDNIINYLILKTKYFKNKSLIDIKLELILDKNKNKVNETFSLHEDQFIFNIKNYYQTELIYENNSLISQVKTEMNNYLVSYDIKTSIYDKNFILISYINRDMSGTEVIEKTILGYLYKKIDIQGNIIHTSIY